MPYFPPTPRSIYITADDIPAGNITLLDDGYWASGYVYLDSIHVETTSTDWDLYLCQDSSFNISDITTIKLVANGLGSSVVPVNISYDSLDGNVFLVYENNVGTSNVSLYIVGRTL
jgi:hypothetical protein